jgi:hypothetical protein
MVIVDAYGSEPEDWPAEERDAALALAGSSLDAARALAEARSFDAMLRASAFAAPVGQHRLAFLQARIMSQARPAPGTWIGRWFGLELTPRQLWPSLAGLAVAAMLGFGLGLGGLLQAGAEHDPEDFTVLSSLEIPAAAP